MIQTLAHDFLDVEKAEGFDVPSSAYETLDAVIFSASRNLRGFMKLSGSGLAITPGAISDSIDSFFKDKGFSYKENGLLSHALATRKMDCKGYAVLTHSVMEKAWQRAVSSLSLDARILRRLMPHRYQQFPVSLALEPNHVFLILDFDTYLLDWETTPEGNNGIVPFGGRERYCLRKFQKDVAKALAYFACAVERSGQGRYNDAIRINKKAIRIFPNYGKTYANLAVEHKNLGTSRKRRAEIIEEGMSADSRSPDLYSVRSSLHLENDDIDAALEDISKAISMHPVNHIHYRKRASLYMIKRKYDEGISDCRFVLLIKPEYADAYLEMGGLHEAAGKREEAVDDYSKYIELRPDDHSGYNSRGCLLKAMDRHEEASRDFEKADKLSSGKKTQIIDHAKVREAMKRM